MKQTHKRFVASFSGGLALILFAGLLACAPGAMAAKAPLSSSNGEISGTVFTSFSGYSSLSVSGAEVRVLNTDLSTSTDQNGLFVLTNVPQQRVVLMITAQGLKTLFLTVDLGSNPLADGLELEMTTNPPGDSDNDGRVDVGDAVSILQSVATP